jgi:hypothetical protein
MCTAGADLYDVDKETLLSKFDEQGSNIFFVLDGFDECHPDHESTDLIRDIIIKTKFKESTWLAHRCW